MNNKKVYIFLTDTGTLFTRVIKLYTKNSLNHASIALDKELEEMYSFGRKNPKNPFIGGFVKENIHSDLFKGAKCAVYSCSVTESEYNQLKINIQIIKQNEHCYKYNIIGLFGIVFNKVIERKNAFFCSQFVVTILKMSRVSLVDKPLSLVTPQDLMQADRLQLEYKGELHSYPFLKKYMDTISLKHPNQLSFTKIVEVSSTIYHKVKALV
ncbi:hypothetical protein [Bacillus sp. SA1-12]|uniref:hypothetical protein n=1 Tax=Bacillus sp. SA1-12 TaxID=1455638 RepID=UPI000AC39C54|nr:hypothetical protein [Bacillus sp. SA1-12]